MTARPVPTQTAPLSYLIRCEVKNAVRRMLRQPKQWLPTVLLCLAVIAEVCFIPSLPKSSYYFNCDWLYAGIHAAYLLIFVAAAGCGFAGLALFEKGDDVLLFGSPADARRILVRALFRHPERAVLLFLLFLLQYGWMYLFFDVSFSFVLLTAAGGLLAYFTSRLTAVLVYALLYTYSIDRMTA